MIKSKYLRIFAVLALCVWLLASFPNVISYLARMMIIAWVVAFALEPMCDRFARKLPRGLSAWLALATVMAVLVLAAISLIPAIVVQTREIIEIIPDILSKANDLLAKINQKLSQMGMGAIDFKQADIPGIAIEYLGGIASSAGGMAQGVSSFFLGAILGVFILTDIDEARFKAEMLVPSDWRELAIRMSRDVSMGLKMYVRGQLTVCVIVAILTSVALWLTGVKSPVALGAIVGIFNIIPYFGPILGGVPVVIIALSQSLVTAIFAVIALFVVQQIDSVVISPRVMSGATGLKPASTIVAMSIGGAGWGTVGMLLALPAMLILKIALRTWASRND
ncbi:MAG: AI-2E family transporter [Clostridia bacterium]|nr:AI-2E family transporter [Clostridia bacterium]